MSSKVSVSSSACALAVSALHVLALATLPVACGARSLTGSPEEHTSVTATDAGVIDEPLDVVAVRPATPTRPNEPADLDDDDDDDPPQMTRPDRGRDVPGGVTATPPMTGMPPMMAPPEPEAVEPEPAIEPEPLPEPGVQPEPEPTMEPPIDVDPTDTLWLYIDTGTGSLVDLYSVSRRFDGLASLDPEDEMLKPWSPDATQLATLTDETLMIHDLTADEAPSSSEIVGSGMVLHGWVEGRGPLISYYYEGAPLLVLGVAERGFDVIGRTPEESLVTRATSHPTGSGILFATDVDGVGYLNWVGLINGATGVTRQLMTADPDVLTDVAWSSDGNWLAFSGSQTGSLFLFNTFFADAPVEVGGRSDYYEFASSNDAFLNFNRGDIDVFFLDDDGSFVVMPIDNNGQNSPAAFGMDSSYIYYADGPSFGVLRRIGEGLPGDTFPLVGFGFGCPLYFTAPDTFLFQRCGSEQRDFARGVVDDTSLSIEVLNPSLLDQLVIGDELRCFANWTDTSLEVGSIDPMLTTQFTRVSQSTISHVAFARNDAAVVWVEGGSDVYWVPLSTNCVVSTPPIPVSSPAAVRSLAFIGRE